MTENDKVDKSNVEDILSLTPAQAGILYHYLTTKDEDPYLEQLSIRLTGELRIDLLREAWQRVSEDNEMLRTIFRWKGIEKPVQIVLKHHQIPFVIHKEEQSQLIEEDRNHGIDIARAPFRITIHKFNGSTCEMLITHHHIIYDGWSGGILVKEFLEHYEALLSGDQLRTATKAKYKSYVKWHKSQDKQKQAEFWGIYLEGLEMRSTLQVMKTSNKTETGVGEWNIDIQVDLEAKMRQFVRMSGTTLATLIYTAWGIVLQKYARSNDIVFGTTVSGRIPELVGIDYTVGLFINTVPVRVKSTPNMSIAQLIKIVGDGLKKREEFDATPIVDLVQYSSLGAGESLFDMVVVVENYPLDDRLRRNAGIVAIERYEAHERTHYTLTMTVFMHETLKLRWAYHQDRFDQEAIRNISSQLLKVIEDMVDNPHLALVDLQLLDKRMIAKRVAEQDSRQLPYPYESGVHQWFERQVSMTPDHYAVVFGNLKMTYRELNEKSNQLAWLLIENGVKENCNVGIMIERSIEMIAGVLAIIKAGGTYVPIDPEYPQERVKHLLVKSNVSLLLSQSKWEGLIRSQASKDLSIVHLDMLLPALQTPITNPDVPYNPTRLLYVLFTSGSTGEPKGVMIRSHAFVNLLQWFTSEFQFGEEDRLLLIAPTSFDLAQKNLFAPLITGGTLVLLEPGLYDYKRMSILIENEQITRINCAPSAFYPLIDFNESNGYRQLSSLKSVFLGGEPLQVNKLIPWTASSVCQSEIVNTYGPTECTDIASYCRMEGKDVQIGMSIPIGKAISNAELYVMDGDGNLLPEGVIGELWIGGVGVAEGYYGAVQLTEERFVVGRIGTPLEYRRLYRTGDLVRWDRDSNLEYLGRTDHQAKIRGFRIEPAEIENQLIQHVDILEAVVMERRNARGEAALCAYIVSDKQLESINVRGFLKDRLPGHMIPDDFVFLKTFPLTPNGKIDRRALPEPILSRGVTSIDDVDHTGASDTELALLEVWIKVLGHNQFGFHDPFFEVGGNSITLMQLHALVEKQFPDRVQIADLFSYSTIRTLASHIQSFSQGSVVRLRGLEWPSLPKAAVSDREKERTIRFQITEGNAMSIGKLATQYDVDSTIVFMSLFVFLLAEQSEQSIIPLHCFRRSALNDDRHETRIQSYEINLEGIDNFEDLFRLMSAMYDNSLLINLGSLPHRTTEAGEHTMIIPLFYKREDASNVSSLLKQRFDLRLELLTDHSGYSFTCTYNERKLNSKIVSDWMNRFVQLTESIISHSENKEEGVV